MLTLTTVTGITFYVRASAIYKIVPVKSGCVLLVPNDKFYVMETAAEVMEMMK